MTWWSVALWVAGMLALFLVAFVAWRTGRSGPPAPAPLESGTPREGVRLAIRRRE